MIKLKKKIQFCFKKFFQLVFLLIYGKINYQKDANISNNIIKRKIENIHSDIKDSKSYFSYKIKNGRVYTDYVEHVAIIDGNTLINETSYQQVSGELKNVKENIVLTKGTPRIKKKIKGRVLSLIQGASGNKNYFHWLCDILPKIKLCSEHYPLKEIDFFYAPSLQDFQKQTLSILNIDENKILNSDTNRHIEARELITVDHPWYHKGFILNEVEFLPAWIIHWLRDVYLNYAKQFDNNEKIYIDRTESEFKHCQIQNDKEVFVFLKEKGFSKYRTGELSFLEQIYLFNNAKFIIGAHGAAFTNLAFCKPNTNIIEIKPFTHPNNVNKRISQINNLNYKLIKTKELNENQKKFGDIYLPIETLKQCITSFD
tara:strand:+ start:275 stop:1387 length:1113 start_codon:yes stop_codon:yes gene_type:complete